MSKQSEWGERIAEQAMSGESVSEYCAKRGIQTSTFSYWKSALKKSADKFIAVGLDEVEIHLAGGTIIKSEVRLLDSILKVIGACAR